MLKEEENKIGKEIKRTNFPESIPASHTLKKILGNNEKVNEKKLFGLEKEKEENKIGKDKK